MALVVPGLLQSKLYPFKGGHKKLYVPKPTWGNHLPIMRCVTLAFPTICNVPVVCVAPAFCISCLFWLMCVVPLLQSPLVVA